MNAIRKGLALTLCCACANINWAQQVSIDPVRPSGNIVVRPYKTPDVPPIRAGNSERLRALVRAGALYLTAQDAIALVLENNVDLEVARYNPLISAWQLQRAQAGGALPGVPSGASQAGTVASGQGVAGSQAAVGVGAGGGATTARSSNATITQVGPVTQTLDPAFQETTVFSHTSQPQPNITQSLTPVLVSNTKVFNASLQQGFLTGGSVTVNYTDHYLKENAPTDLLNPSVAPSLSVSVQHNLLRGFGVAVNARTITVARLNLKTTDLNFRTQVINTVGAVLNVYYGLAAGYEDVKAKSSAAEVAQQLFTDTKEEIRVGSVAPIELTAVESQLATSQQSLVDAQANLQQREVQLKNLLSRTGAADPLLSTVRIIPVDRLTVSATDDLPPIPDLVRQALANRSDLAVEKLGIESAEISALGTKNGILPTVQVLAGESQAGLAGTGHLVPSRSGVQAPDPYFVGGIDTALGQIFRRNFPTERIGAFVAVPLLNRQAQADYGIDQLQLRQTQLSTQKDFNQVQVDVTNYVVALRQAKARYDSAVRNRGLNQQLLDAERRKLVLGASTPYNVIVQQRDLTAAQSAETAALVSYTYARIALDQTLGTTLETNHVSIDEARAGKIARVSSPPRAPADPPQVQ
jgi:outer membrane protein